MPTKITLDHVVIQSWAEKHQGIPELIAQRDAGNKVSGLRLDFPGTGDDHDLPETETIENLTWEQFFKEFENLNLAFEYETEAISDPSLGYRFIKREVLEKLE
jgi:hypothetical protein